MTKTLLSADDRRGDHGDAARELRLPQQLAIVRRDADEPLFEQLHVLRLAVDLGADDRRIVGGVVELGRPPADFAGRLVERGDRALLAAGRAQHEVAVEQHRLAVAPVRLGAAELVDEMGPPDFAAVFRADADQRALAAQCVDQAVFDGGRRARPAAPVVLEHRTEVDVPQLFAGVGVERDQLALACVILRFLRPRFVRPQARPPM